MFGKNKSSLAPLTRSEIGPDSVDKFFQFLIQVIQILRPDSKRWIVRIFVFSGIALLSQRIWEPYLQAVLQQYLQLNVPNAEPTGWTLVVIGIALYFINIYVDHLSKPKEVIPYRPAVDLTFEASGPFVYTEPAGTSGHAVRGYRVKVTNTGTQDIGNCIVYLDKMISLTEPGFKNAYLPIALITQQQRQQKRRGGEFQLRSGQPKFIDVAWLDERSADSQIVLQYEDPTIANMVRRGDYILSLVAYGGGPPVSGMYRLFVDDAGYLRFERYVEQGVEEPHWIEETIVVDSKWPVASGFQKKLESQGYKIRWSRPEKVPSRRAEGYEVVFDIDSVAKKKRRIELKDGSLLIRKRA